MAPRVEINEITISRLARDIARDIVPVPDLLKTHQLTIQQYEAILDTKIFQRRLEEEIAGWAGDNKLRIQTKAMAILEEGLIQLYDLIHDPGVAVPAKIDGLKFAAKLSGMENGTAALEKDDRFTINITIGGRKLSYEQERAEPRVIEGDATLVTPGVNS